MENLKKIWKNFQIPTGFKAFIIFYKNNTENQRFGDICSFIVVFLNWIGNYIQALSTICNKKKNNLILYFYERIKF